MCWSFVMKSAGNSFENRPLGQKTAIGIENFDSMGFAIRDVNFALRIDHHPMRKFELTRPRSARAPFQQVFSIVREFHHAVAGVAVRNIEVAVRGERHVRGQVEGIMAGSGHPFVAELHEDLALRIHFVDHVTGSVDNPDVVLRVHTNGVRAAGIASRRPINSRVKRVAGHPVSRSDRADLALAEHAVAPGTHELPVAFEFHDRVGAAMQHEDMALGINRHAGDLNEIPRTTRRPCRVQDLGRPFRHLSVAHRGGIGAEFGRPGRLPESQ